mgnify:CR=1 FL=1
MKLRLFMSLTILISKSLNHPLLGVQSKVGNQKKGKCFLSRTFKRTTNMVMRKKTYPSIRKTQLDKDKEVDRVIIQISDCRQLVHSKIFQWKETKYQTLIKYQCQTMHKLSQIFSTTSKAPKLLKCLKRIWFLLLRTRCSLNSIQITKSYRLSLICFNIKVSTMTLKRPSTKKWSNWQTKALNLKFLNHSWLKDLIFLKKRSSNE